MRKLTNDAQMYLAAAIVMILLIITVFSRPRQTCVTRSSEPNWKTNPTPDGTCLWQKIGESEQEVN